MRAESRVLEVSSGGSVECQLASSSGQQPAATESGIPKVCLSKKDQHPHKALLSRLTCRSQGSKQLCSDGGTRPGQHRVAGLDSKLVTTLKNAAAAAANAAATNAAASIAAGYPCVCAAAAHAGGSRYAATSAAAAAANVAAAAAAFICVAPNIQVDRHRKRRNPWPGVWRHLKRAAVSGVREALASGALSGLQWEVAC